MAFRTFVNFTVILIVAASLAFMVRAGWLPWGYAVAMVALAAIAFGFMFRRRYGPQVPLQVRPRRHPDQEN